MGRGHSFEIFGPASNESLKVTVEGESPEAILSDLQQAMFNGETRTLGGGRGAVRVDFGGVRAVAYQPVSRGVAFWNRHRAAKSDAGASLWGGARRVVRSAKATVALMT